MFSMSLGLRSAIRLTWLSWVSEGFDPCVDLVTAFWLEGMATLLPATPSTTYSGSDEPLIDVTPRIRICIPPPGAPELAWMDAPTTFPCSACSTVCAETRATSSPLTVATAFARFRRSTPVACPVITTSDRRSGSRVRTARSSVCPADSERSAKLLPIRRIETTIFPSGTLPSVNLPPAPVVVESAVPLTDTRAPSSGCPVSASVTVPVIVRVCAAAGTAPRSRASAITAQPIRIQPPAEVRMRRCHQAQPTLSLAPSECYRRSGGGWELHLCSRRDAMSREKLRAVPCNTASADREDDVYPSCVPKTKESSVRTFFQRESIRRSAERSSRTLVGWGSCSPSANSSIIFRLNAGLSSGLRLVTSPSSVTTSRLTHSPPAFRISVRDEGHEVRVLPATTTASTSIHGAWQIAATGFPASKKLRTNCTALSFCRRRSGFITPPGSSRASKSSARTLSSD